MSVLEFFAKIASTSCVSDDSQNLDALYPHLKSHFFWRDRALGLKHAAECLLNHLQHEVSPDQDGDDEARLLRNGLENSFTMLTGMAMENLIKAIHIKQKTSWSSDLSWTSGGHNQIELARQANIPLEESEEELLRSLSAFVVWAGRYPVPKNADQLFLKQRKKGQKSKRWFPEVLNEMEYKAIEELFRKLNSILSPKLKKLGSRYIG